MSTSWNIYVESRDLLWLVFLNERLSLSSFFATGRSAMLRLKRFSFLRMASEKSKLSIIDSTRNVLVPAPINFKVRLADIYHFVMFFSSPWSLRSSSLSWPFYLFSSFAFARFPLDSAKRFVYFLFNRQNIFFKIFFVLPEQLLVVRSTIKNQTELSVLV